MTNPTYRILLDRSFTRRSLSVDYQPHVWSADRSDGETCHIDELWQQRELRSRAEGRDLYDSELYRLDSFSVRPEGIALHLGDTSYKEYVATRHPSCTMKRADPIGTAIIPISADGFIPVGRRSSKAEVNPGRFFTFGGFFDRQQDCDRNTGLPDLFHCAQREVKEEFGLALTEEALEGLGIVYDELSCHPEISFGCRLPLAKTDLHELDWSSELADLTFVHVGDLEHFVRDNEEEITSTLVGGFALFSKWMSHNEDRAVYA